MKTFDMKKKMPKLEEEIMEQLLKLVQDKPQGKWFKFNLELEFEARNQTDDTVEMSALILKPKEEAAKPETVVLAGMQALKGSKEGAASFMKAVEELYGEVKKLK